MAIDKDLKRVIIGVSTALICSVGAAVAKNYHDIGVMKSEHKSTREIVVKMDSKLDKVVEYLIKER